MFSSNEITGVDLTKILGEETKTLGEKVVKSDKCMGVSQLLWGTCPGSPPKSTPMNESNQTMIRSSVGLHYWFVRPFR